MLNTVLPEPRSSGVPTERLAASIGTMLVPLAASTVFPSCMTTTAWVPPRPGRTIGIWARWVARSIGTTTLSAVPDRVTELVTTYADLPSGDVVTAKLPNGGVPRTGKVMGASAVRVPNSTGVTDVGHTTYPSGCPEPTGPGWAGTGSRLAWIEQPESARTSNREPTIQRCWLPDRPVGGIGRFRSDFIRGPDPSDADRP